MIGRDPKYFLLRLRKSWNNLKCRNLIVAALTVQREMPLDLFSLLLQVYFFS
jgi:hypothetical protein